MESSGGDVDFLKNPNAIPDVAKVQSTLSENPADGWEKCWEKSLTPWDYGQPTPIVVHLLKTGSLRKGRVLVPGCGSGHDVVAIASPERYVVGLDISQTAVKKAQELSSPLPNANCFTFCAADFFSYRPTELFDLMFDYTFFCAIDPCMRSAWASQIDNLLKPDGELLTLIFPIGDYDGGPPYAVSVAVYEKVLNPLGFKAIYLADNELAIGNRKGREKVARWRRSLGQSPM